MTRKQHTRIPQDAYLDYLKEHGSHSLWDLAIVFDVSEVTARRKLNGLIYQGKVESHIEELPYHGLKVRLYSAVKENND